MSDEKYDPEDDVYVLRYYRGENENPWDEGKKEEFKKAMFWFFERCVFKEGEEKVREWVCQHGVYLLENSCEDLMDHYGATDAALGIMAYMRFCSDCMMPVSAFREYMSGGEPMHMSDIREQA